LGLKVTGDRFAMSFEGAELFSANDRSIAGAGNVALWTNADGIMHFAALTITPSP
jgi:hypothetical protein